MHKLTIDIPTLPDEAVICYADDICIVANSQTRLQALLDSFAAKSIECGLVISITKSRVLHPKEKTHVPIAFKVNNQNIETCGQHKYLGVGINSDIVNDLHRRLKERLKPSRTLTGKNIGINIKYARLFYMMFVRSLVDYNALHLINFPSSLLDKLEVVQNEAMRIILGAPRCTRIINMREELKPPTILERE